MKLTDLRDELTARADSTDETPDLLPGVRRKITQTKRRRTAGAAGAVGGIAVIAAFATGLIPGLTSSTPQPADDVPHDYTKDGVTLHGVEGPDRLEKGWIGDVGENAFDFSWTPESQDIRFAGYCTSNASSTRYYTVSVNDHVVGTSDCIPDPVTPGSGISIPANNTLWLLAPAGKPAKVVVELTDGNGRAVHDGSAQIALGIYRTAATTPDGPPTQAPPTSADDYLKDGIRYRARIGGDTLLAAKVADRGTSSFDFDFTAPGGPVSLSDFCTATSAGSEPQYTVSIRFNGEVVSKGSCSGDSTDAGTGTSFIPGATPPPAGQRVKVTVRLEDMNGRAVSRPHDWVGVGIYAKGKIRTIDDTFLDELKEYAGHNYRLADVKLADARTATILELATPADKPFLVAYGTTALSGDQPTVRLTGLSQGSSANAGGGIGMVGEAARPAGTAKVNLSTGRYTSGHLIIALYLPAD